MWIGFTRIILRNRLLLLICVGIVTVLMWFFGKDLKMSYQMAQMLPQTDEVFVAYEDFKQKFGKDGSVVVLGVGAEDIFKEEVFNAWYDLTQEIKNIQTPFEKDTVNGVENVMSLGSAYGLKKNVPEKKLTLYPLVSQKPTDQLQMDSLKQVLLAYPFYKGILYDDNFKATLMAITLNREVLDSKYRQELFVRLSAEIEKFESKTGIYIHKSGLPYIRANSTTKVAKEIKMFLVLAILVTAFILYLFFRSFKATIYSMLVVGVGVIWSTGVLGLCGYEITILTGLIPPLIVVIGIPNCIFLLNKYHQEHKEHGNQIKALSRVIQKVGNAIFLTNTTTALGFATFIFTQSAILVEFGIVTSISIFLVFILSIILIPIIFSFLSPPTSKHTKHLDNKLMINIVNLLDYLVVRHRKAVYVVTLFIIGICVYGVSIITTTGNIVDDLPKNDPIVKDLQFFEQHFKGVMPFEILIDTKKPGGVFAKNAKTLYKIQKLKHIMSKYPQFSEPISIVEAVKFAYQGYKKGREKFYILPPAGELKKLRRYIGEEQSGDERFASFIDSTSQYTRVSYQMADIGTEEITMLLDELRPKIEELFPQKDYSVTLTGTSVVFLKGTNYLVKNLMISLFLAVIIIAAIMSFLFRSARMVLVSLIPNLLPLLITAGLMGIFQIPIKPSTILVFSIAFGISVDDTIHFLAKYRQELAHHKWNITDATRKALQETGVSMIYTSIILFFGFGIFIVSNFGGTKALGILVSITLMFAMLSNLLLLPSLLLSLDKMLLTKVFREEPLIQILDEEEDIDLDALEIKKEEKEKL